MKNHKIRKVDAPVQGGHFRVSMKGKPLYEGEILEYSGGCWAKIKIEDVVPGEYQNVYKPGQIFDLKVAMYNFEEIVESE